MTVYPIFKPRWYPHLEFGENIRIFEEDVVIVAEEGFYPSYSIDSVVPAGSAILGLDLDTPLPIVIVDSDEIFGKQIRNIGTGIVQYLTIPTITLPARIEFSTIEGTEVRYSFHGRPHSKSTKYIEPFILSSKPGTSSLVKLRFRAFVDNSGVLSPLQSSKTVIAQFYVR